MGIGLQNFEKVRKSHNLYIDKTNFIMEWWKANDDVTLIARPRCCGKTLNMSMLEKFFSVKYAGRGDLFEVLSVWRNEEYRQMQGTWPVITLSFANIKEKNYETARRKICQILPELYSENRFLLEAEILDSKEKHFFENVGVEMEEYDTPMKEAYVNGYSCTSE